MRVKLIVLLVLIITTFVWAKDENENILEKYMKDNNVSGTVVIKSLKSGKTNIYNKERSENKYLPASTFKIVNTLIALQEKIVKDEVKAEPVVETTYEPIKEEKTETENQ